MRKIMSLFIIGIIFSVSLFGATVNAEENSSIVSTQYTMFDELTAQEKDMIVREQPNIAILHDNENIKLVYKKAMDSTISIDKNNANSPKTLNSQMSKTQDNLPKAGENSSTIYLLIGSLFAILSVVLFIWKRKEIKALLLLFILSTGVAYTTIAEAAETTLPKDFSSEFLKGNSTYSPHVILEGYEYIGYIHTYSDNESNIEEGSVIIKYQDTLGETISPDTIIQGKIGEEYTTQEKIIEGYKYYEVLGKTQGKFEKEKQTVIFVYDKIEATSTVVVSYLDDKGNSISEEETLIGVIGTDYEAKEKIIEGYTLKEVKGEKNGQYSTENKAVKFIYDKNKLKGTIVLNQSGFIDATERGYIKPNFYKVTYFDLDGNILKTEEIDKDTKIENQQINIIEGDPYTVYAKVTYECYSVETEERLEWGDYELIADEPNLTKGIMEGSTLTINYTFNDLSYA